MQSPAKYPVVNTSDTIVTDRLNNLVKKPSFNNKDLIENIESKALRFLQFKIDKAIDENDIGTVEKILSIVRTLKN